MAAAPVHSLLKQFLSQYLARLQREHLRRAFGLWQLAHVDAGLSSAGVLSTVSAVDVVSPEGGAAALSSAASPSCDCASGASLAGISASIVANPNSLVRARPPNGVSSTAGARALSTSGPVWGCLWVLRVAGATQSSSHRLARHVSFE